MFDGVKISNEAQGALDNKFPSLIHQASRAAFWNALLLPLLAVLNLAFAVIVRRWFGLFSGVYDIVLGLSSAFLLYSSAGIPTGLTKILPEIEATRGASALARFFWSATTFRLLLLVLPLLPLNLLAEPIASRLDLGPDGVLYLRLLSVLVVARATIDLMIKTLNSFFANLRSNIMALCQAILDFVLVGLILLLGYGMGGVFSVLMASSMFTAIAGTSYVHRILKRAVSRSSKRVKNDLAKSDGPFVGEGRRFMKFSSFTYLFELSLFFVGIGFAGPALAIVLDREQVALFAVGFKLALMTVVVSVSAFRGLYRPVFARVRIQGDPHLLQRAFVMMSKAQLLILLPAGVGLLVMSGDYVPLLFGVEFQPAVPIAQILVGLMYLETAFNLGIIVLFIHERYYAVFLTQAVLIIAAPLFLIAAKYQGLLAAAVVFGGARLVSSLIGYSFCRQTYGFRFPWSFAGRVFIVSCMMGVVLVVGRSLWSTSVAESVILTLVGMLVVSVGFRISKVLGPDEIEILERAQLPMNRWLLAFFGVTSFSRDSRF